MEKLQVVFSKNSNPGALIVRVGTWSKWSHCALVVDEDRIIDSRPFHGVQERSLTDFVNHANEYVMREVDVEDATKGIAWARTQIGKPYDWGGVVSFAVHRDWKEADRWFCSELCESAIVAAGRTRFITDTSRISPQTCWMTV